MKTDPGPYNGKTVRVVKAERALRLFVTWTLGQESQKEWKAALDVTRNNPGTKIWALPLGSEGHKRVMAEREKARARRTGSGDLDEVLSRSGGRNAEVLGGRAVQAAFESKKTAALNASALPFVVAADVQNEEVKFGAPGKVMPPMYIPLAQRVPVAENAEVPVGVGADVHKVISEDPKKAESVAASAAPNAIENANVDVNVPQVKGGSAKEPTSEVPKGGSAKEPASEVPKGDEAKSLEVPKSFENVDVPEQTDGVVEAKAQEKEAADPEDPEKKIAGAKAPEKKIECDGPEDPGKKDADPAKPVDPVKKPHESGWQMVGGKSGINKARGNGKPHK
jgi:hypothetical protein